MMYFKKDSILILIAFVLSSCTNDLIISQKSYDSVSSGKKALVFLSAEINHPEDPKEYRPAATTWRNRDREDDRIPTADDGEMKRETKNNVSYSAYIVNPGKYDLTAIIFIRFAPNSSEIITTEVSMRDLMNFEIKGGEVLYLGHITFSNNGSEITYKVSDKYGEAYERAKTIFPELQYKLNKRIIYGIPSTQEAAKIIATKTRAEKIKTKAEKKK